jgi:hypothetical protein
MIYYGCQFGNSIAISSDPLLDGWQKLLSNPIVPIAEKKDGPVLTGKRLLNDWDPHGWLVTYLRCHSINR